MPALSLTLRALGAYAVAFALGLWLCLLLGKRMLQVLVPLAAGASIVAVATLVLEQLRMIVRSSGDDRPRIGDLARLFFQPLDPFLVDGSAAVRPGQIRRASLSPIWLWVVREGAPDAARDTEAVLATTRDAVGSQESDKAVRAYRFQ